MSDYLTRNKLALAKIQGSVGTEASPTVGSDAIQVRLGMQSSPNFELIETNYVRGGLDNSAPIIGGGYASLTLGSYLKGAGTAGQAPEISPLLRAAGMAETLTAADVTGTAQSGTTGGIVLETGESSSNDAYNYMVIEITDGTGEGQQRIITDYVGSSRTASVYPDWDDAPDNTSVYAIHANARYMPRSSGLELVTLWAYQHATTAGNPSRRCRLMDAACDFRIQLATRGLAGIDFTARGVMPALPDDVSHPGAGTFDSTDPAPFIAAMAYLGGNAVKFGSFDLSLGGQIEQDDNPAALYGYDAAQLVGRQFSGNINPSMVLNSTRDAFSDWLESVSQPLWLYWGPSAGKRVSIYIPELRYTGNTPGDQRGYAVEQLPFRAPALDAGAVITFL